ncbi:MAG: zinc ribbon domain-containing protein [Gammaproteobacteria bacterium]|nr:zinc ribbon domain-containing protein [Gammaproteobacteria bacterium]
MPIYEYQCDACGRRLEITQRLTEKPLKECPHCRKKKLRKLISAPSFQLKGTGWYVTDFRDKKRGKKHKEKAETEKPAETTAETGSAGKETAKSTETKGRKPAEKASKKAAGED